MYEDTSVGEEYEDIDMDPAGVPLISGMPGHGVGVGGPASPSRRPPMPLPGPAPARQQQNGNYSYATGPRRPATVHRSSSVTSGKSGKPVPPLPPPNKGMNESLAEQLKRGPPLPNPNRGWPRHKPGGSTSEYDVPKIPPEVPKKRGRSKTTGPMDSDLPPIPPKPIDIKELEESLTRTEKKKGPAQEYITDAEELSLEAFVKKYQDDLPLHVRVCKGFYGHSERTSVSEGDQFNIHFIKKSQVVNIMDGCGSSYKVALNSALEFGIMYNPNKNREEALAGFKFNKVSEILQHSVLPKVVRVTEGWRGTSSESTIEYNELLILKGLKRRINHKYLKAVSLLSKEKKELPENCTGKFSTRPYDVRLYLPQLMELVDNPLPTTAVLFVSSETSHELPSSMVTSVVTLTSLSTETSLIATSHVVEDVIDAPLMDIPYDLDIELQVLWPKSTEDTEQLYADTRTLLENFKPSQVSAYITNKGSDSNAQSAVYAIVKEGNEMAGVDLVKPSTIYYNSAELMKGLPGRPKETNKVNASQSKVRESSSSEDRLSVSSTPSTPVMSSKLKSPKHSFPSVSSRQDSLSGELVDTARLVAIEERIDKLESQLKSVSETLSHLPNFSKFESDAVKVTRDITSARADMKRLEARVMQTADDSATSKTEITKLGVSLQELKELCETFQTTVSTLQNSMSGQGSGTLREPTRLGYMSLKIQDPNMSHSSSPQHSGSNGQQPIYSTVSEEDCQRNREFLATLDSMQVLSLLDQMGLRKHQETFMEERVNGEILLECDDEVLYQELRVTSKIHRVRLMKIISGRHSAEGILRGEDPYVYASSPR